MKTEKVVASFLKVASEDLEGARILAKAQNRNAIYLCSQAAEKVIRAVLTSEGEHAGIGHQLDRMIDKVPDENPVKPLLRSTQDLGSFATSYRYPTVAGRIKDPPRKAEFERLANAVELALQEVVKRFEVDVNEETPTAGNVNPIR